MGLLNKATSLPGYMLGLALLVPSAALMVACWICPCVWVWRRWRYDPGVGREGVKRMRQNVSVEFVIPESVVGYVIGRRGASVRQVEEESGARVQFKDQQGSKDKVVVVSGRPGCVANARKLIETAVDERLSTVKNQQIVTLTLPQRAVGRVIGRQGANIRAIQRESGAKVTLMSGGRSDAVRMCEVCGSPEQLSHAVSLIQELVGTSNKTRPPPITPVTQGTPHTIEPLVMCVSSEFTPVFVSSVDGHGGVWIQPIKQEDPAQLESLVDHMTRYYGNSDEHFHGDIKVGDLFAALFDHDSKWYRVCVTSVSSEGVEVVYLDYGDYACVKTSDLRPLRKEHYYLKAQAVRCILDSIIPTDGVWREGGLEALEDLTHSAAWRVIMAKVTVATPTRIQLVDTSGDKEIDIAEQLVATGHAQWAKPHPPFPRTLRYHRDGPHPLLPYPDIIALNNQSNCSVSYVQSPDLLFLIPIGYELMLSQLCARMNIVCDQSDCSLSSVKTGDFVAACIPLDNQWYRSHVISFNQSDCSALLRLVDYGVVVCLPLSQLKPLTKELCEESVCCVPCSLAGVKPNGSEWCDGVGVFLREATNQGDWTIFSVTKNGCHSNMDGISIATVILQSLNKGVNLNSNLVAKGFAAEIKGRSSPEGGEECERHEGVRRNVRFRWCGADNVSVAGSFSDWKQVTLQRGVSGEFETAVDIPPGTHQYKYLVDGKWQHDHSQPTTYNGFGTLNNVMCT